MEWIKCSDRLPHHGKDVLISNGHECWMGAYKWYSVDDGSWSVYMNGPFRSKDVTHWQELPNPPQQ